MFSLLFNASYHKTEGEVFLEFLNDSTPFCSQFMSGQWYCYILLVLFSFALPVGIVGNIAALLAFSCFRKMATPGTVFLLNLALCDSAWMLMLPFNIYFTLQRPYLHGIHIFCQLKKVSFNVNIYGSIFFLTLVSFDRYVGTVHPIRSLGWWDVGRARLFSGVAWALLLLGSIPDLFVTFGVRRPGNVTVCMDHIQGPFEYVKSISLVRTLVGFVLPFAAMLGFYAGTVRAIRGLPGWRRRGQGPKSGRSVSGKPLLLITAALLLFVVSFVPYHVMIVTLVFLRIQGLVTPTNTGVLYAAYEFLEALCSISSCLDPVLYILASERFQRRLQRLGCRRSGRGGGEQGGGGGGGGGGGSGLPIGFWSRASRRVGVES